MKTKKTLPVTLLFIWAAAASIHAQVPSYVPTTGLAAWYPFSGNANDASGNGNNAANSSVTFIADRIGIANAAGSFNGFSSVLAVNVPGFTFSETGGFTYSVWMNKSTQPSAGVVVMSGTNTAGNFISNIQGQNNVQFGTNKQQFAWVWAQCPHTLNQWDHYVAVYDSGAMTIFKNGTSCGTATYTNWGAAAVNMPFYIGRGLPGAGNNYNGALDDIGVWTRALTQTEITGLYNSVTGLSEISEDKYFDVFPNPATERITIHSANHRNNVDYKIIDSVGRIVISGALTKEDTDVDIHHLAAGLYKVQVGETGIFTFSRIKN